MYSHRLQDEQVRISYWFKLNRRAMPELMLVVANDVETFGWLIC